MQKITLEILFEITGIGSASGLVCKDNSLFIISDNSSFLYQYHIRQKELSKIKLFKNSQENIPKKEKFDLESIVLKENKLHILGSGSTSQREKRMTYNLESEAIIEKDLSKLYQKIKQTVPISDDELNIEGAVFCNQKWHLFQRGNEVKAKNGILIVDGKLNKKGAISFVPILLPKINQYHTSFTDAILVEDKIYFLATAEASNSTYNDGEILGSIIGRMDSTTFEIEFTEKISETQKFEGLTLYKKTETEMQFLLCEDNDTVVLETKIYKLTWKK